jgi:Cu(I)/Ag(I) efflux system periplasmic protein CusF
MKIIKHTLSALLLAVTGLQGLALAQDQAWTEAEVRRLDLPNQKITLKHGEIKNLDMPPMTMVFDARALPTEQLRALKVGDKLRFQVAMVDGRAQLTAIER